ncbi:MAG TPA: PilZ domain-containing protein [Terriglobales bacterium]
MPYIDKAFGTLPAIPPTRKAAARAAFVDIKEPARSVLTDCFKQFGIDSVAMNSHAAERLSKEKFEACVVKLSSTAEKVMEAARRSPSNSRMIIYGLGGNAQDAMRYSRYGINAVFNEPVERQTALKLVRATQMLVVHEFRRYVRVPVITEVSIITSDTRRFTATSKELSSGGMSLKSAEDMGVGTPLEVSFALLTLPRIWVKGSVCWKSKNTFGVRFDPNDDRRLRLKEWVDAYLES